MKTFTKLLLVVAAYCFLAISPIKAQHCVDGVIFRVATGKFFIFHGNEYARFNEFTNAFDAGYPKTLDSGVDFQFADPTFNQGIDAVCRINAGGQEFELFFKDDKMIIYTVATMTFSAPVPIANNFGALPQNWKDEGIDAATALGSSLELIKGTEVRRFNVSGGFNNPPAGSPATATTTGWYDMPAAEFTGLDAVLDNGNATWAVRGKKVRKFDYPTGPSSTATLETTFAPWPWEPCNQAFVNGDNNLNAQIPDNECTNDNSFPFMVNAATMNTPGTMLGMDIALAKVSLVISHSYHGDLTITLTSPGGTEVELITQRGGTGDGFGNSVTDPLVLEMFTANSIANIPAQAGVISGSFKPEGNFATFNNNTPVMGEWKIKICDGADADIGNLEYIKLDFSGRPNAVCASFTVVLDQNGMASTPTAQLDAGSTSWDGMPIMPLTGNTSYTCSQVPSAMVTHTVTGNNGITGTCMANITVRDADDPDANCRQNVEFEMPDNGTTMITPMDINNNSSDNCEIETMTVTPSSVNGTGTFLIELEVVDKQGNRDDCSVNVTVVDNITSVEEIESLTKFDVFPNPTNGEMTVSLEFDENESATLSILNIVGKEVTTLPLEGRVINMPLDLTEMADGVYFVAIRSGNAVSTKKVILSK